MKKVVKFGGSSLANAEQFQKVGEIIRSEESRRYVVPSAPGKRFDGDTKVTDMLYSCYEAAEAGQAGLRDRLRWLCVVRGGTRGTAARHSDRAARGQRAARQGNADARKGRGPRTRLL